MTLPAESPAEETDQGWCCEGLDSNRERLPDLRGYRLLPRRGMRGADLCSRRPEALSVGDAEAQEGSEAGRPGRDSRAARDAVPVEDLLLSCGRRSEGRAAGADRAARATVRGALVERVSRTGYLCPACFNREPFRKACGPCGGKGYLVIEKLTAEIPPPPAPVSEVVSKGAGVNTQGSRRTA